MGIRFIVCIVIVQSFILQQKVKAEGLLCYSCDLVPHPRDCDRVIQCGEHEVCYGEKIVTEDGITYYKSGCNYQQACQNINAGLLLGKRSTVTPCAKCCNTSYCNKESCDTHVQEYGVRCLSCRYALTPDQCIVSVQCNPGEMCYSQAIIHNHERRYRLGCISSRHCAQPTQPGQTKRQTTHDYCGQCCDGENCNRELCSTSGHVSSLSLDNPPPLSICHDNSSLDCFNNRHRCSEEYFKFYMCPFTCGFCPGHVAVNHCLSSPCQNNGTCINNVNSFTCSCVDGFSGSSCETDIDECSSSPCLHRGTCHDGINSFTCTCRDGYTGHRCGININECISSPCLNGATCHDGINRFTCTCRDGFTGHRCETNIDECSSSPCLHRARCHDQINSFTCQCRPGFNGTYCETDIDECSSSPCLNGATCHDIINAFICRCRPGFTGDRCQTNINECSSSPCLNGATCHDGINSFTCSCRVGFTGDMCESKINECSGPRTFTIGDNCYYLTDELTDWKVHNADPCRNRNMTMAVIHSNQEHDGIVHHVRGIMHETMTFWLGGYYDPRHHGHWYWIDGSQVIHNTHWHSDSGGSHIHHYCMVMEDSKWDYRHCDDPHIHLCESVHTTTVITSTTEITLTQGDCHGNNSFHYSGHCYFLLNDIKRRHEHDTCHHHGNYQLAVINNNQEQMAVVDFVRNTMNYHDVVWLRGYYVNDNNQHYWGWRRGDRMDLNSHLWKDDPHTHHGGCVVLDGNQWGIRLCEEQHYQLCEEI